MKQPGEHQPPIPDLPIAALLRLAADDELTAEQRARLDAHLLEHPEDGRRIEFERSLRCACARACCPCGCAPAGLRERILAQAATGGAEATAGASRAAPRRPDWGVRAVVRFGAVAAAVALVAVMAFLVGRSGQERGGLSGRTLAASLAGFVVTEHERCAGGDATVESKFFIHDAEEAANEFGALVGRPVSLPCLRHAELEGLRFVDAGLCHPPGGDALHMRFRRQDAEGGSGLVSLWVQEDDGRLPMEDGVTYTLGVGCDGVRVWRLDGIRYVLVCSRAEEVPAACSALASPRATQPL